MKNRPDPIQGNAHAPAMAFSDFCSQRTEERLHVSPSDASAYRILEDLRKRPRLFAVHRNGIPRLPSWRYSMVSPDSTNVNRSGADATTSGDEARCGDRLHYSNAPTFSAGRRSWSESQLSAPRGRGGSVVSFRDQNKKTELDWADANSALQHFAHPTSFVARIASP